MPPRSSLSSHTRRANSSIRSPALKSPSALVQPRQAQSPWPKQPIWRLRQPLWPLVVSCESPPCFLVEAILALLLTSYLHADLLQQTASFPLCSSPCACSLQVKPSFTSFSLHHAPPVRPSCIWSHRQQVATRLTPFTPLSHTLCASSAASWVRTRECTC